MRIRVLTLLTIAGIANGQDTVATLRREIAIAATRDGIRAGSELGAAFKDEFASLESEQKQFAAENVQLQRMKAARFKWLPWRSGSRKRLSHRINADARSFQRQRDEDAADFEKERSRIFGILDGQMRQVAEEYARQNGFTRIIDTTTQPAPPGARDVTSAIIAAYNKEFTDNTSFVADKQPAPCLDPPNLHPTVENQDFAQGAPGSRPQGWNLPAIGKYKAEIVTGGACHSSPQCARLFSLEADPAVRLTFLYQNVDAKPYRGRRLTFRAQVRANVGSGSAARLLVRVHRTDCTTSFRDDMGNHPISADTWSAYEIQAPVAEDARDIEFGIQLVGQGKAWIDNISFSSADPTKESQQ